MKCEICSRGIPHGVTLYRQNEKGVAGIYRCTQHNTAPVDIEVAEIVNIIEGSKSD